MSEQDKKIHPVLAQVLAGKPEEKEPVAWVKG